VRFEIRPTVADRSHALVLHGVREIGVDRFVSQHRAQRRRLDVDNNNNMDRDCINTLLWANVRRSNYLGCFPADELPTPAKWPCSLVANTDPSGEPGTHWVAMYMPEPRVLEYFCPLGQPWQRWPLFERYIRRVVAAKK